MKHTHTLPGLVAAALLAGCGPSAGPSAGAADPRALAQTQALGAKIEQFKAQNGRPPASLYELTLAEGKGPYAPRELVVDPWGRQYYYRVDDESTVYHLFTLGADGRIGGSGADADVSF
jgi:general secretion pathway protein G